MQINGELCISAEGEGMAGIAFKYWREKEQSAEVSKKGSKTPPPFRTKPKQIPEKSVLVDLDSSTGKGRFEKCRESDV